MSLYSIIIHLLTWETNIHALHKNINTVAMLMCDVLLRHFRKGMYHREDRRLHTLIPYVLLIQLTKIYSSKYPVIVVAIECIPAANCSSNFLYNQHYYAAM